MELRHYARLVLRWWWLFVAALIVSGLGGYLASVSQPAIFRSTVTLMVREAQGSQRLDYSSLMMSERLAHTYVELIRKSPVTQGTIDRLSLPYSPQYLARLIQVRVVRDTQLLEVSVENQNPELARDIANTLAEVFIAERLQDQRGQMSTSRELLRQQIADLEKRMKEASQALDVARQTRAGDNTEISRLQSDLSQTQVTYSQLVKSEQEMLLAETQAISTLAIVESASAASSPIRPLVMQNILLSCVLGLILGLAFVFFADYLDDSLKVADDIQRTTQLATLAVVGRIPAGKMSISDPRLLGDVASRNPFGEAYRILRTNVDFAWLGEPGRVLMLTSANPREGKTTTLANLAAVFAKDSRSVIVIDCDLRRPSLHRAFGVEGTRGLTSLLVNPSARAGDYLRTSKTPNLMLLPSGPIPPNPSELLGMPRFNDILEELKQIADIVLIDTPPVLAVADTAIVATRADGVVLVVEAGATRSQALVRSLEALRRSSARILGVVLNKQSAQSGEYYSNYYYDRYSGSEARPSNGASRRGLEVHKKRAWH